MSRIHEALKKAEQERASAPVGDLATISSVESHIPVGATTVGSGAAPRDYMPRTDAASSSDYLRFDDLRKRCAHPTWHLDPNVNVFINSALTAHGAEQFRTLRSRLYQMRGAQALKTLLVTSSVPAEGKTFVTNNLAQSIVRQPDRRVLIIDADLRCSRLHVPLGAPASPGLTDYLKGEADEASIIQNGFDGNLCFIPGGTESSHPSELLSNGRLKALIARMAPVFDWVILDSPPLLPVADSSFLADLVDGGAAGRAGGRDAHGDRAAILPGVAGPKRRWGGSERSRSRTSLWFVLLVGLRIRLWIRKRRSGEGRTCPVGALPRLIRVSYGCPAGIRPDWELATLGLCFLIFTARKRIAPPG
jgi:protein-tyrosine kinase